MEELLKQIDPTLIAIILSLGFGAVLGLEREIIIQRTGDKNFGGIRTYSFIGLLGAMTQILSGKIDTNILFLGYISILILTTSAYIADRINDKSKVGITSEITALITFIVGVLCGLNEVFLALVCTLSVLSILALRNTLHKFAKNLENEEIYASLKFGIIAFIVLPLLPNITLDPLGAFNPYKTWFIIVLITGLNFLAYILTKFLGAKKGITLSAFFGGFVSSTAVNLNLAEKSKEKLVPVHYLILALLLAQASSLMMTGIELFMLNKELFKQAIVPIGLTSFLMIGYSIFHSSRSKKTKKILADSEIKISSPFTLSQALILGGIFTGMIFVMKLINHNIGETGLYISGALSGLISVDATAIAISEIAGSEITYTEGTKIIMLSIMTSMLQKCFVLWTIGTREFAIKATFYLISVSALLLGFAWIA